MRWLKAARYDAGQMAQLLRHLKNWPTFRIDEWPARLPSQSPNHGEEAAILYSDGTDETVRRPDIELGPHLGDGARTNHTAGYADSD